MSDHDDEALDAIDRLYRQAEGRLQDDDARAARRARIAQAVQTPAPIQTSRRRSLPWRQGGWLTAATAAAFGIVWMTQISPLVHAPSPDVGPPTPPIPPITPAPPPSQPPMQETPPVRADKAAPPVASKAQGAARSAARAAPEDAGRRPRAFPASPADASNHSTSSEQSAAFGIAPPPPLGLPPAPAPTPPVMAPPAPAAPAAPAPSMRSSALSVAKADDGARLREAAMAGRTGEIEALLDAGASVDAVDAHGRTALMQSVMSDRPAAAALLLRRGADADRKDADGESARDLALKQNDPALNKALGPPSP